MSKLYEFCTKHIDDLTFNEFFFPVLVHRSIGAENPVNPRQENWKNKAYSVMEHWGYAELLGDYILIKKMRDEMYRFLIEYYDYYWEENKSEKI